MSKQILQWGFSWWSDEQFVNVNRLIKLLIGVLDWY